MWRFASAALFWIISRVMFGRTHARTHTRIIFIFANKFVVFLGVSYMTCCRVMIDTKNAVREMVKEKYMGRAISRGCSGSCYSFLVRVKFFMLEWAWWACWWWTQPRGGGGVGVMYARCSPSPSTARLSPAQMRAIILAGAAGTPPPRLAHPHPPTQLDISLG